MISVLERAKAVRVLDRTATAIDNLKLKKKKAIPVTGRGGL
jgi:hypothetical protein